MINQLLVDENFTLEKLNSDFKVGISLNEFKERLLKENQQYLKQAKFKSFYFLDDLTNYIINYLNDHFIEQANHFIKEFNYQSLEQYSGWIPEYDQTYIKLYTEDYYLSHQFTLRNIMEFTTDLRIFNFEDTFRQDLSDYLSEQISNVDTEDFDLIAGEKYVSLDDYLTFEMEVVQLVKELSIESFLKKN